MNVLLVRQGTKFGPEYVSALIAQLPGHRVVTLTERPDTPGEKRALKYSWPGWWAKLELFAPYHEDLRPFLFLDLDTFVLGDLKEFGNAFLMLRDFNRRETPASGMMWVPRETPAIFDMFLKRPREHMRDHPGGDQSFLAPFCQGFIQDEMTGVYSYKVHCREAPKGIVICFHGRPKPHDAEGWARAYWNQYV